MIKIIKLILIIAFAGTAMEAQELSFYKNLYNDYADYKEKSLYKMDLKHSDILSLIIQLKENQNFSIEELGKSVENREIFNIKFGNGPTNVLLWSQMHGDEPTATMALFDIFNFLKANDKYNDVRENLKAKLTINFVPMLNPDGSEKYQRRNALNIDINRDALALKSPESQILKKIRDLIEPEFGFNLHDQSTRASVSNTNKQATISLLAPAFDKDRNINETREKAIKLAAEINSLLSTYIPGHIARYDDEFEPRAFGDNIQKWGTSTILIESGGWKNDDEKQYIRKLNFVIILNSLLSIANRNFLNEDTSNYFSIPKNDKYLYDLLLRNIEITRNDSTFRTDIGINLYETSENGKRFFKGLIDDMGDLSTHYGVDELDCTGMSAAYGLTFQKYIDVNNFSADMLINDFVKKGYTTILGDSSVYRDDCVNLPVNIKIFNNKSNVNEIRTETSANLILQKGEEKKFVIVNGFIFNVVTGKSNIKNAVLLK